MMGLFLSAYNEEEKEVTLELVSIASVASAKSEVLMDKLEEILWYNNIDIFNIRFPCLEGTNTMSGERTGLQRRIRNVAPFSIYINYRCPRLTLCFTHLFDEFPWHQSIEMLLFGLWKGFYYSGKNCHILKFIKEAYGLKTLNLVKAAVNVWFSHGAACKRCRGSYRIIIEVLDDVTSTSGNPELVACQDTLLDIAAVYQTTSLEEALSVTNILPLLRQSDKNDFSAISRFVDMIKFMAENRETNHLKNFNNTDEIIQKIGKYQQKKVSSGFHERLK